MFTRKQMLPLLAGLIAGALVVVGGAGLLPMPSEARVGDVDVQSRYPVGSADLESPFVAVAEKLKPSVVFISVVREQTVRSRIPFFDLHPFFGEPEQERGEPRTRKVPSSGSGIIIDQDGLVLTNNHVVENATSIKVKLADGEEREAELVGTDPETDLALLRMDEVPANHVAPLGDSDNIRIGDWAIAMGNPLGLDWTLTVGVVSAKGRSNLNISGGGPAFQDFIQTDASINFGNSGGPLANIHGEVIGINAAVNASADGIGFAIPVNMAKEVVRMLLEEGSVQRGYLGMVPTPLEPLIREALELDEDVEGVFVEAVEPGTPAQEGGLRASDVIVEVDGEPVDDVNDFRFRIARHRPGDSLELTVIRDGDQKELEFTLADRADYLAQAARGRDQGAPTATTWLGIEVAALGSPQTRGLQTDVSEGVVVVGLEEDSPAEGKLRRGDIIREIDQEEVSSLADWRQVTSELGEVDRAVLIKYHPQGRDDTRFVALKR